MDDQRDAIRADLADLFQRSQQARRRQRVLVLALALSVVAALIAIVALPSGLLR